MQDSLIDHAVISTDHPQSNGQAEKAVHIVKRALTTVCAAKHNVKDWDTEAAWLALGYRCSPHRSTGITPYELMYARAPVIPPAVLQELSKPLDYDNPRTAVKDLEVRHKLVKELAPMALENLAIAQHRDQLRYLRVRAADYQPRAHHFKPGQYVYVQQLQRHSSLQARAQPVIYRVVEVKHTGVLTLQGKCGRQISMHMSHCAPCHLQNIDGSIDPRLAEDTEAVLCEVCNVDEREDVLLICDICTSGYHTYCLQPALDAVPEEEHWLCPTCVKEGYTVQDAENRAAERERREEEESRPVLFPDAAMKKRDAAAALMQDRLVHEVFRNPSTGKNQKYWGRVTYLGPEARPDYFMITYEDGDTQGMNMRKLKKWLQPEGTQLPEGVVIPPYVAAVAIRDDLLPMQQHFAAVRLQVAAIPSVQVPDVDLVLLRACLCLTLAQVVVDPLTRNGQWQCLCPAGQQLLMEIPFHNAWILCVSPIQSALVSALHQAFKLRAALLVCYAPSLCLPPAVAQLIDAGKKKGLALALRATFGWWLIFSKDPVQVSHWLR